MIYLCHLFKVLFRPQVGFCDRQVIPLQIWPPNLARSPSPPSFWPSPPPSVSSPEPFCGRPVARKKNDDFLRAVTGLVVSKICSEVDIQVF